VLSMRELQELSGVSHNTIWRIESGRQGAHPRTIRKLAEALGVEPEELLKKEELSWARGETARGPSPAATTGLDGPVLCVDREGPQAQDALRQDEGGSSKEARQGAL
jgi:transcriptional regulator with XRE-family HTH domain